MGIMSVKGQILEVEPTITTGMRKFLETSAGFNKDQEEYIVTMYVDRSDRRRSCQAMEIRRCQVGMK
jgi:hypothetical protein